MLDLDFCPFSPNDFNELEVAFVPPPVWGSGDVVGRVLAAPTSGCGTRAFGRSCCNIAAAALCGPKRAAFRRGHTGRACGERPERRREDQAGFGLDPLRLHDERGD